MPLVSIIIATFNRFELFQKCIEFILQTTSHLDREIIIWDNCSTDGTRAFLEQLEARENIRVIHNDKNIGINAKGMAIRQTTGDYIVGVDDDVISLPEHWVEKMMAAFKKERRLGYLALDVVQDEYATGAKPSEDNYRNVDYGDNVTLQFGPIGGWCFMIPRNIYNKVGPLRYCKRTIFYCEDYDYTLRCHIKDFLSAILKDVKCYHATGGYYNDRFVERNRARMQASQISDLDFHKIKRTIALVIHYAVSSISNLFKNGIKHIR